MLEFVAEEELKIEIIRIVGIFAREKFLEVDVFFHRPESKKFNDEWYRHRGFCNGKKSGPYKLYVNLDRDSNSLIFRTLAHEFAHVLTNETEERKYLCNKHSSLFWKTMDEQTLPFVKKNLLSKEEKENLSNLLNPATNNDEELDWIHLETKMNRVCLKIKKEKINQEWRKIKLETIKGNLGKEARVTTNKKNKEDYWIFVYANDRNINIVIKKLEELGFDKVYLDFA